MGVGRIRLDLSIRSGWFKAALFSGQREQSF
jgi:hypothetical protein